MWFREYVSYRLNFNSKIFYKHRSYFEISTRLKYLFQIIKNKFYNLSEQLTTVQSVIDVKNV